MHLVFANIGETKCSLGNCFAKHLHCGHPDLPIVSHFHVLCSICCCHLLLPLLIQLQSSPPFPIKSQNQQPFVLHFLALGLCYYLHHHPVPPTTWHLPINLSSSVSTYCLAALVPHSPLDTDSWWRVLTWNVQSFSLHRCFLICCSFVLL